jgi:hypothetical protein
MPIDMISYSKHIFIREYIETLRAYIGLCDDLLGTLDQCQLSLEHLEKHKEGFTEKTSALQTACDSLLGEQVREWLVFHKSIVLF